MGTCFSLPFNAIGGLWAGPYLLDVQALDKESVSFALLAMVAAFHLGNLLYGPVERRLASRKRTIAGGVLVMIALLGLLAAAPRPPVAPVVVLLVLFCLCTPFYPVLAAHCRGFVPLGRAGRAIACVNLMGLGTVFLVQQLTGWLVELTAAADGTTTLLGYRIVFVTVAVVLALGLWGYSRAQDVPP
jgi:predicted MFS family arabinose efflux permease